jgi:4-alpha-glucanotransferase
MFDRAWRWGVVPEYSGYTGERVTANPAAVEAVLGALGANKERPPRIKSFDLPQGACAPPPERVWGWAVQLYALRSRDSWGVGDLADLRRFGLWARRQGASVTLLNPLGAQVPTLPYQPSPYYSSSRRFLNAVYVRVEDVPGAERCAAELEPLRREAQALNAKRLIDYDQIFKLKSKALDLVYAAAPTPRGLSKWIRQEGDALRDFATFNSLAETLGPAWRSWPVGLRQPNGHDVENRRVQLQNRVGFHQWVQFQLDRQLARASTETGLITDIPLGFASDSFDAWRWQHLLAPNVRVGAPPDEFFQDGQDWGVPAFDPWKLRAARCAPFVEAIRSAARHAAGVRLDHVMGLFRLFWIPDGMTASQGVYVRYPEDELLALLAEESRRANAFVVGEDLGLVEPSVRRRLRKHGALSYRLLWFEGGSPGRWPKNAVGAIGTHDLPTVAGIWNLIEPDRRLHRLRKRLVDVARAPDGTPAVDVAVKAYRVLARGRTCIVLAQLEDALGVEERPNVPGTTTEFPNWRLALPSPFEEIARSQGTRRIASAMRRARRTLTAIV